MTYEPDRIRIDLLGDWEEGFWGDICPICGCRVNQHPPVEGYRWLTRLCTGELVKT